MVKKPAIEKSLVKPSGEPAHYSGLRVLLTLTQAVEGMKLVDLFYSAVDSNWDIIDMYNILGLIRDSVNLALAFIPLEPRLVANLTVSTELLAGTAVSKAYGNRNILSL